MLGTANGQAAPLLGRLEEQKLLSSLLDEVGHARAGARYSTASLDRQVSPTGRGGSRGAGPRHDGPHHSRVQSEAHLRVAGLRSASAAVRARAADLPAVQRAALDAAFG